MRESGMKRGSGRAAAAIRLIAGVVLCSCVQCDAARALPRGSRLLPPRTPPTHTRTRPAGRMRGGMTLTGKRRTRWQPRRVRRRDATRRQGLVPKGLCERSAACTGASTPARVGNISVRSRVLVWQRGRWGTHIYPHACGAA